MPRSEVNSAHPRLEGPIDSALLHLDLDQLLGRLLVRVRDGLGADTCAVLLLDEATGELVARAGVGIEAEREPYRVREGGSLLCFVRDPDDYRIELIDRCGR